MRTQLITAAAVLLLSAAGATAQTSPAASPSLTGTWKSAPDELKLTSEFDKSVATYTISAVPDPVAVLREMKRVVKPGGVLVILNHFRSERRVSGWIEDMIAPVCTRLGWKSNLQMGPLLREVGLTPELVTKVNLFNGWRLVKCVNRK